ncbi:9547_t:CDS:2 [Acaulospora morrowiae]|uniref:Transcription initiation factor TFIID subunit 10 n=1 Tax=Acaulospora morrowiae TaxID=94023 RepID=A0A9N9GVI0_9GLOM|nr:9547_t:CDS:2 [Acaulospora morrowiae]
MSDFEIDFDGSKSDKGKGKEILVESPNKTDLEEEMGEPPSGGETLGEYPESSGDDENYDDDNVEGSSSSTTNRLELSRKEEEFLEKDRSLLEFLLLLDEFEPLIPELVTEYYFSRAGVQCDDVRVMRLMSLAAQKFLADIATDAFQYCKIRQQSRKNVGKRNKTVLTLEDLTAALSEYGVNIKKPDYYRA